MTAITIISFGYLHSSAPEADFTFDARRLLHDPARIKGAGLLDEIGTSAIVSEVVRQTGAEAVMVHAYQLARLFAFELHKPVTLAFGCAGGKHRAPALAEMVAAWLRDDPDSHDVSITLEHRHMAMDRVLRDEQDEQHGTGAQA